jgi:uncharacterized protein YbjT (DUF2867 family)
MEGKTAVVLGATGLIGRHLTEELLHDNTFSKVRLLVRKAFTAGHPKLEVQELNFDNDLDIAAKMGKGDIIFCCIGTTRKKVAGDKTAYRKVDYDIPMNTARIGIQKGFSQYVLVSAVGANAVAGNFYLQLKGSVEEDIMGFSFKSIYIFRPSILVGKRNEFRLGERIGATIMQLLSVLLLGALRKYKPVHASIVAKAMISAVKQLPGGVSIYEYDEIKKLARTETTYPKTSAQAGRLEIPTPTPSVAGGLP